MNADLDGPNFAPRKGAAQHPDSWPEPMHWPEGRVELVADGRNPTLAAVYDGEGCYRGAFRVGVTTLQYMKQVPGGKKKERSFKDATDMWVLLPKWLRAELTEKLHLQAVF